MDLPALKPKIYPTITSTPQSPSPPVEQESPRGRLLASLKLNALPQLKVESYDQMTKLLNWKPSFGKLTWLTRTKSEHYSITKIRKKSGSTRTIHNPDKVMRLAQWRICSNVLNLVEVPSYIWGFERGKSVPKMAEIHKGQKVVISLDIKDFFPSIKQDVVQEVFHQLGVTYGPAARTLSELCTYRMYVPQGALTSPKLSNIVAAASFGPVVKEFCDAYKLNLTIYADDITMSFTDVPEVVDGRKMTEREFVHKTVNFVKVALNNFGFRMNKDKTKVMRRHNRQWVCGAVVNDKVNLMKRERGNLRALVHNCVLRGIDSEAHRTGHNTLDFIRKYGGKLNWYRQLNPEKGNPLYAMFKKLSLPLTKQYPDFDLDKMVYDSGIENPQTRGQMLAG